jgi:transposase
MCPIDQLPEDTQALKEMVVELFQKLQRREGEVEESKQQMQMLLRAKYGRKGEAFDPQQMMLFEEVKKEEEVKAEEQRETNTHAGNRDGHGRKRIALELPRKPVLHEITGERLSCPECGETRTRIGEETSEQYDYVPASVCVVEHVRCKYACLKCQGQVILADAPSKPIAKGMATAGMLAHVATSKFADHLPLHRLEGIFKRQGARIARSTMCDWLAATAVLLQLLYEHMKKRVLSSRIIWTDDTPVKLQDRDDERNMREARIWVYIGDGENRFTIYDFTDSRKRDGPRTFLENFKGYLQADAFAGYDCIYDAGGVLEVACMAHARRKFFECLSSNEKLASEALAMIGELYRIEKEAAPLGNEERRKVRLEKSAPVLVQFKKWLDRQKLTALPKSPLGKSITYALNNWKALCRYLCDGELTIDNNRSERAMRGVAIGRKNWLFAGSKEGGKNAAILSSFIVTCKQHSINPQQYLTDVLTRLSLGESNLDSLLPGTWAPTNL